jgi:uncharacterized membrane protein (UPF0127 family)
MTRRLARRPLPRGSVAGAALCLLALVGGVPAANLSAELPVIAVLVDTAGGLQSLTAEVACTSLQRATGLMGRERLPAGRGMIFLLPEPRLLNMWMRDTPAALHMVFFDEARRIMKIAANVPAFSEAVVSSGRPAAGVIELAAGEARSLGVVLGDSLLYAFPQERCE